MGLALETDLLDLIDVAAVDRTVLEEDDGVAVVTRWREANDRESLCVIDFESTRLRLRIPTVEALLPLVLVSAEGGMASHNGEFGAGPICLLLDFDRSTARITLFPEVADTSFGTFWR